MKDKRLSKIVWDEAKKALVVLGLCHYELNVCWCDEDQKDKENGGKVAMHIGVNRRYHTATIHVCPWYVKEFHDKQIGEEQIRATVCHEVSYIATQHFYDGATATYRDEGEMSDAWEGTTTILGRLVRRLTKCDSTRKN